MLKYMKYISLIILVVIISYVIMLYINSSKNVVNNNNDNNVIVENNFQNDTLYDSYWNISKLIVHNEKETLIDVDLSGNGYIYITDEYVDYCDTINNTCQKYENSYYNKKIIVPDDCLIAKGEYDIIVDESGMQLSKNVDDKIMIYKFTMPKG